MNIAKPGQIQFSFIENGPYLSTEASALRRKVFELWMPEWTKIYASWNSTNVPSYRDFSAYNIIHCLSIDGAVAGVTAHRFMNLQEPLNDNLEYFQSFGKENIQQLRNMGLNKIMTFESLLVSPDFRKSQNHFHVSKLLSYLANQTFSLSHAQGIVGTARKDVKVPQLGFDIGYEVIEADRKVRVIPCDLILQRNRDLHHPEDPSWVMSRRLWQNRRVYLCEKYLNHEITTEFTKKAI